MISDAKFERLLLKHSMALIGGCDEVIHDWQRRTEQDGKEIRPDKNLLVSLGLMYLQMMIELNKELKEIEESEKASECPPEPDGASASHASETDVSGGE